MAKHQKKSESHASWVKRLSEGGFILLSALALFIFIALFTYKISDPGWFRGSHVTQDVLNAGGRVGAYTADILFLVFGYVSYALPLGLVSIAWLVLRDQRVLGTVSKPMLALRSAGLLLFLLGGSGLLVFIMQDNTALLDLPGGLLGAVTARFLYQVLNPEGALLILLTVFLVGVTWLTGVSWVKLTENMGRFTWYCMQHTGEALNRASAYIMAQAKQSKARRAERIAMKPPKYSAVIPPHKVRAERLKKEIMSEPTLTITKPKPKPEAPVFSSSKHHTDTQSLPTLKLLAKPNLDKPQEGYSHQALETLSHDLEQHLLDFGIQANVVAAHPGPVITRFELQLAAGVKVSKLSGLAKDLARSLSVTSVRVVEIIPGKTVVGLELPNPKRAIVVLSEVLLSDTYQQTSSPLTLALGVDIAGHPMVVDLAKMPHLLVAGTTGSGKSVGINAMILSLLFKSTPEDVRMILVDPKMLELSVYDGIPHLLTPVVTDMKEASSALRWCVEEMERRYRLMAALGVRNLAGFNTKVKEAIAKGEPLSDPLWKAVEGIDEEPKTLETLPYIVVVIDELADMMMVVGKKVEQLIARIAQKARAAGIHLILATQRPSVDVLTGLIKSNIPTRISFQVSSKIDSRTILDQQGAEQLLGHGDMLFLAPGTGAPLRVHGAFVDDAEVHRVADDWRGRGAPEYIDAITEEAGEFSEGASGGDAVEDSDPLYDEAVEFIMQTRKASTSSIQRRFKVGYNRAARLIEEMERVGIVGPLEGGMRDVLVNSRQEEA